MEEDAARHVWGYPWWVKAGFAALFVLTAWGAVVARWPGALAIWGYGAPLLSGWACLEAFRRTLVLTARHLESRDLLGGVRRIALDDVVEIAFGGRPALKVTGREGDAIEVPRLFGGIRGIAAVIADGVAARGVTVRRSTAPRSS